MIANIVVAGAAAGVYLLFVILCERRVRPELPVLLLVWLLLIDAALYATGNDVPRGIFHPQLGGRPLRLPDVLVPLTLLGVAIAGVRRRRVAGSSLVWAAFLAWLATEGVLGLLAGNASSQVEFEAKAVIYLGAMALAARIPAERYTDGRAFRYLYYPAAAVALLLVVTDRAQLDTTISLPGLSVPSFGSIGADAATLFAALGLLGVTIAFCSERWRLRRTAAAVALLLPALISGQRAAAVGAAVSLAVLLAALPAVRGQLRVRRGELLAGVCVVAVVFLLPGAVVASLGPSARLPAHDTPSAFVADALGRAFRGQGKHASANSRVNQWHESLPRITAAPVIGHGLGDQYVYFDPGLYEFVQTDLSHDVPLDLLRRTGLVGLLLFVAAVAVSLREGFRSWRRLRDPLAAALGLGCAAVVYGLVAKGMVESIFEKYRLALLLGLVVGALASAASEPGREKLREGDVGAA